MEGSGLVKFKVGDRVRVTGITASDASRPAEWPWFNDSRGTILKALNGNGYIGDSKTSSPSYLVRFDGFDYKGNMENGHTAGAVILELEVLEPDPDELAEAIRSIKEAL